MAAKSKSIQKDPLLAILSLENGIYKKFISFLRSITYRTTIKELDKAIQKQRLSEEDEAKFQFLLKSLIESFYYLYENYTEPLNMVKGLSVDENYFKNLKLEADEKKLLIQRRDEILKNALTLFHIVKAACLKVENFRNFVSCQIFTDIRPIFLDEVENGIIGSIVLHKLKMEFEENKKVKENFIYLDIEDLKDLKKSIDRALKKEILISAELAKQRNLNIINSSIVDN